MSNATIVLIIAVVAVLIGITGFVIDAKNMRKKLREARSRSDDERAERLRATANLTHSEERNQSLRDQLAAQDTRCENLIGLLTEAQKAVMVGLHQATVWRDRYNEIAPVSTLAIEPGTEDKPEPLPQVEVSGDEPTPLEEATLLDLAVKSATVRSQPRARKSGATKAS